jgi:hypothetical protein
MIDGGLKVPSLVRVENLRHSQCGKYFNKVLRYFLSSLVRHWYVVGPLSEIILNDPVDTHSVDTSLATGPPVHQQHAIICHSCPIGMGCRGVLVGIKWLLGIRSLHDTEHN